ncbi:hypothetical protein CR513_03346, partial [Mucuna pruriens]
MDSKEVLSIIKAHPIIKSIRNYSKGVKEQYIHLRNYEIELLRKNTNNIVIIKSIVSVDGPVFERMYLCFYSYKKAFITTCRPLIDLDSKRLCVRHIYGNLRKKYQPKARYTCCDLQVNHMCESFNRTFLEYKDKPIISLVEGIKFYMTNRIAKHLLEHNSMRPK